MKRNAKPFKISQSEHSESQKGTINRISTDQEVKLLENAFLVSSAIEILTRSLAEKNALIPQEQSLFTEVKGLISQIQKANDYLSHGESQLLLAPEGMDLVVTLRKGVEGEITQKIIDALKTLKKITEDNNKFPDIYDQMQELTDFLRTLLRGIKAILAASDNEESNFWII